MDHGIFIASYRTFHHGMGALEYAASVFAVPGLSCSASCGILCPHAISEAAISEAPEAKARRRQWHPTPVLLPGKSHGRKSLVGCNPWGRTRSDTTEQLHFHFHALEKEMATHSSVLAWRIPGMEEPVGLPSMGSPHRVGHD